LASEGLIGRLKREVYVAVVKHISTAGINFEVKRRGASASIRFNYAAAKPAGAGRTGFAEVSASAATLLISTRDSAWRRKRALRQRGLLAHEFEARRPEKIRCAIS
jgi:hypothetical protein